MDNRIYFTKIRDVKTPIRANKNDAGIDFFIPDLSENRFKEDFIKKNPGKENTLVHQLITLSDGTKKDRWFIRLRPGKSVLIPSGIKVWIMNKDSALVAANKSGLATKYNLQFTAEVVDADYTGEVHIGIINLGNAMVEFNPGDKAVQFLHTPVIKSELIDCDNQSYELLVKDKSDRGEGGFGSTDNKTK